SVSLSQSSLYASTLSVFRNVGAYNKTFAPSEIFNRRSTFTRSSFFGSNNISFLGVPCSNISPSYQKALLKIILLYSHPDNNKSHFRESFFAICLYLSGKTSSASFSICFNRKELCHVWM